MSLGRLSGPSAQIGFVCLASVALSAQPALAEKVKTKTRPAAPAVSYSVSVPSVSAVESSLTDAAIAEILRGNVADNAEALAALDARSIDVPEVTVEITTSQDGTTEKATLTFTDLHLDNVEDGIADSVTLGGSRLAGDEASADFGAMTAANIDIGGILGFYGLVDGGNQTELRTIYTDFSMDGGSLSAEDVSCTIGAASVGEVKARPLEMGLGDMMALASTLEDDPDNPDPAVIGQVLRMYADILTALETSEMTFDGFSCDGADDEGRPMTFAVDGMTLAGFKPGFYPAFSMDGLAVDVEGDGSMQLDNFTFKQMDLSNTIAKLEQAPEMVDEAWLEANARALVPAFEGLSFSGLAIDIPDPDDEDQRIKADIGGFDLTLGHYINGIPSAIDTSASNIQVALPPDSDDEQIQQLLALGITDIDAGFRFAAAWNADSQSIDIEEASLDGAGLASIVLAGRIANATEALFSLDEDEALMAGMGVAVKSLDLTVTDKGLADIVLALAAAEQGADPASLRPVFAGLAEGTIVGMMAGAADAAKLGKAVNSFVSGAARTLNITIDAKEDPGLGMADFMAAEDDPTLLLGKVDIGATAK